MAQERQICCCGASSWSQVIAWIQIVANALSLILYIVALVGLGRYSEEDFAKEDIKRGTAYAALSIALIVSIVALAMGIVLLKGVQQKRIGYLKAWLIYGVIGVVFSILIAILSGVGGSSGATVGGVIVGGILGIGINLFTLWVVWVHIGEIRAGVFGPSYP